MKRGANQEGSAFSRRDFLRLIAAGAALQAGGVLPRSARGSMSPNEKVVLGIIGCGGMGELHMTNLLGRKDVEIAAVCDVHTQRYERWVQQIGKGVQGYQDFRRVLDRKDINAIFCATPDHWHALITILACEAGKDVYVEKPMTKTVAEGRRVVEAARRYSRIVQVGLQQRSMEAFLRADKVVRSGGIGSLVRAEAWGGVSGTTPIENPQAPPPGLDWDMWLGPAPWVPYSPERFGAFRAFSDYAGGELTNWGVHVLDSALMTMDRSAPMSIQAHGTSLGAAEGDDHEAIDVIFEFDGPALLWSQGARIPRHPNRSAGTLFEGTSGRLIVDRAGYDVQPESLGHAEFHSPGDFFIQLFGHHDNFIDCIHSRQLPRADCEIGHRSTSLCLLGNIAIDSRRRLAWDGAAEQFIDDPQANRYLSRAYRPPWNL